MAALDQCCSPPTVGDIANPLARAGEEAVRNAAARGLASSARPAAEVALCRLGESAAPALREARTPLPHERSETGSSLRRRRAVLDVRHEAAACPDATAALLPAKRAASKSSGLPNRAAPRGLLHRIARMSFAATMLSGVWP